MDHMGGVPITPYMQSLHEINPDKSEEILEGIDTKFWVSKFFDKDQKYYRFSDWEQAQKFGRHTIAEFGDCVMSVIAFRLDDPVNKIGADGWSIIEAWHEGRDWNPLPKGWKRNNA